jgi:hypothetical protein
MSAVHNINEQLKQATELFNIGVLTAQELRDLRSRIVCRDSVDVISIGAELRLAKEMLQADAISNDEHSLLRRTCLAAKAPERVPANAARSLEDHFAAEAERKIYAWRAEYELAQKFLGRFQEDFSRADAWADLQRRFVARAKAGSLTPIEVLAGQYVFFAQDRQQGVFMLMDLILSVPVEQRIKVHNWHLADLLPQGERESFGSTIAKLSLPLFPPRCHDFAELNARLLDSKRDAISGGGRAPDDAERLFAQRTDPIWGGSWLPIYDSSGQQVLVADATQLDAHGWNNRRRHNNGDNYNGRGRQPSYSNDGNRSRQHTGAPSGRGRQPIPGRLLAAPPDQPLSAPFSVPEQSRGAPNNALSVRPATINPPAPRAGRIFGSGEEPKN